MEEDEVEEGQVEEGEGEGDRINNTIAVLPGSAISVVLMTAAVLVLFLRAARGNNELRQEIKRLQVGGIRASIDQTVGVIHPLHDL